MAINLSDGDRLMFWKKNKRRTSRIDTLIGQHTTVEGDLRFTGGLHVEGTIRGNVVAENDGCSMLQLSERGQIEGDVNAPHVVLNGQVRGNVKTSVHVKLQSKARITGDVYYNLIEMAIGSEVNGKLVHEIQAEAELFETDLGEETDLDDISEKHE